MNIEEAVENLKKYISFSEKECNFPNIYYWNWHMDLANDIEILLTAYEKEKNKKIDEFCRKELAFERRLQRENREPDKFNKGRFYVSENIRKIIEEE